MVISYFLLLYILILLNSIIAHIQADGKYPDPSFPILKHYKITSFMVYHAAINEVIGNI